MNINHERLVRVLLRCVEISKQPDLSPAVLAVYNAALSGPASAYLTADAAVNDGLVKADKESSEAKESLAEIDGPYRTARSALKAVHPSAAKALPLTLKALPTDTDKLNAIQMLMGALQEHAGEPWADAFLGGEVAAKAQSATQNIEEAIAAGKALTKAKTDRAAAFGPAYAKYLDFKQVVRDALGPTSKEYKRIHLRASPGKGDADNADEPKPSTPPPSQGAVNGGANNQPTPP